LENFGVDFIVMACNTIHAFLEELRQEISTPILDLREEVRKFLKQTGCRKIAILGTPHTIKSGLYRFEDFEYVALPEGSTKKLACAIFEFNLGFQDKQINAVRRIAEQCVASGAEAVVLGCTELALILKGQKLPIADTIDILAEATAAQIKKLEGNY